MAAKRKTCAMIGLAIAVALITPRIATASLIDPRTQLGAAAVIEKHAAPIDVRPEEIATDIDDAGDETHVEQPRSLHTITPPDAHSRPKTRVMGSDFADATRIGGEGHLTLRMHWGIDYAYGKHGSRSSLGAGAGPAFGSGAGALPGGGGFTGWWNGVRGGMTNALFNSAGYQQAIGPQYTPVNAGFSGQMLDPIVRATPGGSSTLFLLMSASMSNPGMASFEDASTFVGRRGATMSNPSFQPFQNGSAVIGGRFFSGHALDAMRNRGLVPSVIENTIGQGAPFSGRVGGTSGFFDSFNNVTVIIDTATGRVITAY